jgi:hypothetical protein
MKGWIVFSSYICSFPSRSVFSQTGCLLSTAFCGERFPFSVPNPPRLRAPDSYPIPPAKAQAHAWKQPQDRSAGTARRPP